MKKTIFLLIIILLVACSSTPSESEIQTAVALTALADNPILIVSPFPTYTPFPTHTPYPTYTAYPTYTPFVYQPTPSTSPAQAPSISEGVGPIGTISVNTWSFEITDVQVVAGKDTSRKNIILLGNLTNDGLQTDIFVASGKILLQDGSGRIYEDDNDVKRMARDMYGTGFVVDINPGAKKYIGIGFDVISSENIFTIIPGSLVDCQS